MNRRGFLLGTLLGLGSASCAVPLASATRSSRNPFSLGVASGDVTDTSAVLWTRLAPQPSRADGGMEPVGVPVRWAVAADADFSEVIQQGSVIAAPELAHSVHIELEELEPRRHYWYRFRAASHASRVGRLMTLPGANASIDSLRFVTASCQNYTHGTFVAYEHILRDQPEFIIHLGDYFYETSYGETFRRHEVEPMPATLDGFRRRHALYKTDPHLQRAHAELPFFTMIDNHDAIEDDDPAKYSQRAAAYQAWYEHMPVRGYPHVGANAFDLKRRLELGRLAQICVIDGRQFRDRRSVCENDYPDYGFGNYRERCDAVFKEDRTLLGEQQEEWLYEHLESNTAAWNVLASPGPVQPFSYRHDGKDLRYIGAWDIYPANRQRLVAALQSAKTGHPLITSADVHSFWAVDGTLTPAASERIPITEFVSSSISANWPEPLDKPVRDNLAHNPQVRLYEGDRRGYLLHDVTASEWTTTMRALEDVRDANSGIMDLARFVVRHGEPGFRMVS